MQNVQINNCRCSQTVAGNIKNLEDQWKSARSGSAREGFTHAARGILPVMEGAQPVALNGPGDSVVILTCMMVLNILPPVEIAWICTDGKRSGKPAVI